MGGKENQQAYEKERRAKAKFRPMTFEEEMKMEPYVRFFVVTFKSEGKKRKLCPFRIEKDLNEKLSGAPKSIKGSGENSLLIEVYTKEQSDKMRGIRVIMKERCSVKEHALLNGKKTLIYLQNKEISDLESFKSGVQ